MIGGFILDTNVIKYKVNVEMRCFRTYTELPTSVMQTPVQALYSNREK